MIQFIPTIKPNYIISSLSEVENWGNKSTHIDDFRNRKNVSGEGIKVAVLDAGIEKTHIDLMNSVVDAQDFTGDNRPIDYHGTFVSGIIAADKNGIGVIGVAPDADIYDVRVLNSDGFADWETITKGLDYAINAKVDIINMSLGCISSPPSFFTRMLTIALKKNIIIVAAAGNEGRDELDYPACMPGVIAVGAIDKNNQQCDFSNYGENLIVKAPGKDIYSCCTNNSYCTGDGTSFAAPYISGVIALLKSYKTGLYNADDIIDYFKTFINSEGIIDLGGDDE